MLGNILRACLGLPSLLALAIAILCREFERNLKSSLKCSFLCFFANSFLRSTKFGASRYRALYVKSTFLVIVQTHPNWPLHLKSAFRASNCTAKRGLSIVELQGFAPPELLFTKFHARRFATLVFLLFFTFHFFSEE